MAPKAEHPTSGDGKVQSNWANEFNFDIKYHKKYGSSGNCLDRYHKHTVCRFYIHAKMQIKIKNIKCFKVLVRSKLLNQYPNVLSSFTVFPLCLFLLSVSESHSPVFWWLLPGCYIILIWTDWHQCLRWTGQEISFGVTSAWLCNSVFQHSSAVCGQLGTALDLGSRFLACLTFWAGTTIASNSIGNSFLQANVFSRLLI